MFKYLVIAQHLTNTIQSEQLPAGTKLPSVRDLAADYQCSKHTIMQALKKLEQQHLIYCKFKSGYYIVKKETPSPPDIDAYDFSNAAPDWQQFPYLDFQHCIHQAVDTYQKDLFVYGAHQGLPELLRTLKMQLENAQIFARLDNIFVTSGIQQALSILCQMPFPNEKSVILIEEPSYSVLIGMLQLYRLPVISIPRGTAGLDLDKLEQLFSEHAIKFFYTMPRFHNPLGTSYTSGERKALVKLAQKHDVYLVEDDYLADFDTNKKNDPLYATDLNDKTIYLKSFSKIMFPGLRTGVAILPALLKETFSQYKKCADISTSIFSQAGLEIYINSGMYDHHLKSVQQAYTKKTAAFTDAVQKHPLSKKLQLAPPQAMKTHLVLPEQLALDSLLKQCQKQNILLSDSRDSYLAGKSQDNLLLLDLSSMGEATIREGTARLLTQLGKQLRIEY